MQACDFYRGPNVNLQCKNEFDPEKAIVCPAHTDILELREALQKISNRKDPELKEKTCSDSNCIVYVPDGMHTNGGCKCGTRYGTDQSLDTVSRLYRRVKHIAEAAYKKSWNKY